MTFYGDYSFLRADAALRIARPLLASPFTLFVQFELKLEAAYAKGSTAGNVVIDKGERK